jgi:uncharacterized Zn-binding protein involved in type VI secretion
MPEVARVSEDTVGTGLILTGATKVYAEGDLVAFKTSTIATHSGHVGATITGGSSKVYADGKQIARKGDVASCGHTVASGSTKVFSN